jgi:ABC-2 type transport system ATP-binding protein
LLYNLVAQGITVFVTTHYMDEAERCHRLAFIQHGKLIAAGTPAEIKHATMRGQVLEITPDDAARAVKVLRTAQEQGRLPIDEVALYGSLVHVVASGIDRLREPIELELKRAGIQSSSMAVIAPSLEDVFIASMK